MCTFCLDYIIACRGSNGDGEKVRLTQQTSLLPLIVSYNAVMINTSVASTTGDRGMAPKWQILNDYYIPKRVERRGEGSRLCVVPRVHEGLVTLWIPRCLFDVPEVCIFKGSSMNARACYSLLSSRSARVHFTYGSIWYRMYK